MPGEIQTSSFDETAASNNSAAPNGFPEGMAPSGLNDSARELMAQVKRWFNRVSGRNDAGALISSAGSSATFTVDYDTAPASLYTGLRISFKANADFDAGATVNCNSLGAKNVQKMTASGYANNAAGDIITAQHVDLKFDATLDKWVLMSPPGTQSAAGTVTSVATAGMASGGPITGTGTVTVSIDAQTDLGATPATDDYVAVYDTSASAHKKAAYDTFIPDATSSVKGKIRIATAGDSETGTSTLTAVPPGRQHLNPRHPKAWCFVTISGGTPTLAASSNVSSITDRGAGLYTVNFTTAFSSASYGYALTAAYGSGGPIRLAAKDTDVSTTASAFPVIVTNSSGNASDPAEWSAVFWGDQ